MIYYNCVAVYFYIRLAPRLSVHFVLGFTLDGDQNLLAVPKMKCDLVIRPSQFIIINIHDTQGVGETGTGLPACNDDDRVAAANEAARLSELDAVLNSAVNVFHPVAFDRTCV